LLGRRPPARRDGVNDPNQKMDKSRLA